MGNLMAHPVLARRSSVRLLLAVALLASIGLVAGAARADTQREASTPLEQKAFFRPELYVSSSHVLLDDVLVELPGRAAWEEFFRARGESARSTTLRVYIDPRGGTVSGLTASFPLLPGDGVGNAVTLRKGRKVSEALVTSAVRQFIMARRALL